MRPLRTCLLPATLTAVAAGPRCDEHVLRIPGTGSRRAGQRLLSDACVADGSAA